jgi:type I restriction enzyme R subunit
MPSELPDKPIEFISEADARRQIDNDLKRMGWKFGADWFDEFELGLDSGKKGFADYVLVDSENVPIAVIEAKRPALGEDIGRCQAEEYADSIAREYGRKPVIFITNGYSTDIIDRDSERKVHCVFSKRDLEKKFHLWNNRSDLRTIPINNSIVDRYYQKEAVRRVCEHYSSGKRKALLVMATGSGKTRTAAAIADVMLRSGWVKNILFLADRIELVDQAMSAFREHLPDYSLVNLCRDKITDARIMFSTYPTLSNILSRTADSPRFTPGYFDLIIMDEVHRSIYNKYGAIFDYFDSMVLGLTATPKSDIDRNTYRRFEAENGVPVFEYPYSQGVQDGVLVRYEVDVVTLNILKNGIHYNDLTPEEKEEYEINYGAPIGEDGTEEDNPLIIPPSEINRTVFNRDTIVKVLDQLMRNGLKVEGGTKLGKTIIFARNHLHAEAIRKVFIEQYPSYGPEYCEVIDYQISRKDYILKRFKEQDSNPRIAISVDMLDTGIDVRSILNLVFFKPVFSKAKFWQMKGRGTRTCKGLIDGNDKEYFLIFDFCDVFKFFDEHPEGFQLTETLTLQQRIFNVQLDYAFALQSGDCQEDNLIAIRERLVSNLVSKINELNPNDYSVKPHLQIIDRYRSPRDFQIINEGDISELKSQVSPLILPYHEDVRKLIYDLYMVHLEHSKVIGNNNTIYLRRIRLMAGYLYNRAMSITKVREKKEDLSLLLRPDYLEKCPIQEIERLRKELRDLMVYIEKDKIRYFYTDYVDSQIGYQSRSSDEEPDMYTNYGKEARSYIREHTEDPAIHKLMCNETLTAEDAAELERIFWKELGTEEDYQKFFGKMGLGEMIRSVTGLDREAAERSFAALLDDSTLTAEQIKFIRTVVNYVVKNGTIDKSILVESPFKEIGNISDLFADSRKLALLVNTIDGINNNAKV